MLKLAGLLSVGWFLGGCGAPGSDPRDAPGCSQAQRRCWGDLVQLCVLQPGARTATWTDVLDCADWDGSFCEEAETTDGLQTATCEFDNDDDEQGDGGLP